MPFGEWCIHHYALYYEFYKCVLFYALCIFRVQWWSEWKDLSKKYVTNENLNMRETRWKWLSVVLLWVCVHCGCVHVLWVKNWSWLSDREWVVARQESQERKELGKEKRREKKRKSGLREKSIFLLLCDCVFHSIFPPFQSTMPPLFFLHTPHTTSQPAPHIIAHNTPIKHACILSSFFLWLSVDWVHTVTHKQHNTMQ